jgi:DNA-binding SARP family transcriptional activator/tetratricopeptide (TPR) repeat protein
MIELRVLGTLDLCDRVGGGQVGSVLAQPKRMALLCYLALATPPGRHRRDHLLALFWPDSPEDRARNSLNQAVFNLRRSLGEGVIAGTPEEVGLARQSIWCDAVEFEGALAAGDRMRALDLYQGDLMPGLSVDGCVEFDHWMDTERERLRRRAVDTALETATVLEGDGNWVGAVELLRRATAWGPYHEPAMGRLVGLLVRLGDRPGALQTYERFRERLVTDLAVEPSPELESLARQIRGGFRAGAPPRTGTGAEAGIGEATGGAGGGPNPPLPNPDADGEPTSRAGRTGPGGGYPEADLSRPRRLDRRRLLPIALLSGAALAAVLLYGTGPEGGESPAADADSPFDARRVMVSAFENRTGDPSLDPLGFMAADWIAQGLARTGMARVVPFSTIVQETPHLSADDAAPEIALRAGNRHLARRTGAALLVTGGYYRTGEEIVFQAQVIDVGTGELLRGVEEVRGSLDRAAEVVEQLQRRSLGALATLFDERLLSWPDPGSQPSSLEAYRLFAEGMDLFITGSRRFGRPDQFRLVGDAARKFQAAADLDSAFTMPLLWAGYAHGTIGDSVAALSVIESLRRRPLSRWSAAVLTHLEAREPDELYEAARVLAELSPDSEWLWKLGHAAYLSGRYRTALDALLRIDPDRGWIRGFGSYWRLRVQIQHVMGNYAAVIDDVRRGLAHDADDPWLRIQELWALAALGRDDEIRDRLAPRLAAGDVRAVWELNTAIEELIGHGHRLETERLLRWAIPAAEAVATDERNPGALGELAYLLFLAGRVEDSATLYRALLLERPRNAGYRSHLAILAARTGDTGTALETVDWLNGLQGQDLTLAVPFGQMAYWGSPEAWRSFTLARILAQLGHPDLAVERLRAAREHGLSDPYLHLHDDPHLAPLRGHPGFQGLLLPRG